MDDVVKEAIRLYLGSDAEDSAVDTCVEGIEKALDISSASIHLRESDESDSILVLPETGLDELFSFLDEACEGTISTVFTPERLDLKDYDTMVPIEGSADDDPVVLTERLLTALEDGARLFTVRGTGQSAADSSVKLLYRHLGKLIHDDYCEVLETPGGDEVVREAMYGGDAQELQRFLNELITKVGAERHFIPGICEGVSSDEVDHHLPEDQRSRIFLAGKSVLLSPAVVPVLTLSDLIGSESECVPAGVPPYGSLIEELQNTESLRYHVFEGYKRLLSARARSRAFHPASPQAVFPSDRRTVALLRGPYDGESVLCLHNLSGDDVDFYARWDDVERPEEGVFLDLVSGDLIFPGTEPDGFSLTVGPWEQLWLRV